MKEGDIVRYRIEQDALGELKISAEAYYGIHTLRGKENFDLTPAGIIKRLDLTTPRYSKLASHGHFGRLDLDLPWERLDYVDTLKKYLNK